MKIRENGIGSNYRTIENNPISPFHDDRIEVEFFPGAWGKHYTSISCPALDYESGLREFNTEQESNLFARQTFDKLLQALDNKEELVESVIRRILSTLEDSQAETL